MSLSVIVPLRVSGRESLGGLRACLDGILSIGSAEVILVDQCHEALFAEIDGWFDRPTFVHLRVDDRYRDAANQKMAAVLTALDAARGDKICIFDDDFRPTPADLSRIVSELDRVDCLCCDVFYRTWNWAALSSTCTRFVKSGARFVYDEGYEPAHVCFTRRAYEASGAPPSGALFDDLVVLRHFRKAGFPAHRLRDVALEKTPPSIGKFWEQRFRYAYEELAYPKLFAVYILSLPLLLLATSISRLMAALVVITPSMAALLAAARGYASSNHRGRSVWAIGYAPLWYWLTAIFVWTVPFVWLRGGCRFGGRRIRRVV